MIKLVYCIRRKPGMSREAFQQYWLGNHARLVKRLARHLGAERYVQSHRFDSIVADRGNQARGSAVTPYDGITEFWWQTEEAMNPPDSSTDEIVQTQKELLEDEREFIDIQQSVIFMTYEHQIY